MGDTDVIKASIAAHGFFGACVVQRSTGYILVGNHRHKAALETNEKSIPVLWADVDDVMAKRILIADNRTAEFASWDDSALQALLVELAATPQGLEGVAFSAADLESITGSLESAEQYADPDGDKIGPPGVVMADPVHQVKRGEVYRLGVHVLIIGAVTTDWPTWVPYLVGDAVFCAHPSPFLALSTIARNHPLVMVTSNHYLAGHVLDKWTDAGNTVTTA